MKIVVVSDNHGRSEPLEQILELHRDADVFIHCGDSELPPQFLQGYVCVRGNNGGSSHDDRSWSSSSVYGPA